MISHSMLLGREPINTKWSTDVRFGAHSGLKSDITALPKCANRRLMHRSKRLRYSITSSARPSSVDDNWRPSAFAVSRLTIKSNLVGCSTRRSAGLAPFRILST